VIRRIRMYLETTLKIKWDIIKT